MIKLIQSRGTGKTLTLLRMAEERGYSLLVANNPMAKYAVCLARQYGIEAYLARRDFDLPPVKQKGVEVFWADKSCIDEIKANHIHVLVDEADAVLNSILGCGVVGYSISIDEINPFERDIHEKPFATRRI
ncbi:MAG: hypothetical protein VB053_06715 [Oscillibacter ruminantium]|uniref:hypothetical protein n=1 Tax=Oscillibacter ruminantium TaxID=1263547 RepID=UPI002B1EAFFF|nr:hypothetical protein [Oscillibacter ruminantium]MEA5042221.1 hypothetical protein [Oscillibacter ruminantium]